MVSHPLTPEERAGMIARKAGRAQAEPGDAFERMDTALREIERWSRAYPTDIFHELSKAEWKKAAEALNAAGITLDAISASAMRHVVNGVGEIARKALPAPEESDPGRLPEVKP